MMSPEKYMPGPHKEMIHLPSIDFSGAICSDPFFWGDNTPWKISMELKTGDWFR